METYAYREEATWEKLSVLKESFPNHNLEDKVVFEQGSIGTNTEGITTADDVATQGTAEDDG